jgi:hypothetical protein
MLLWRFDQVLMRNAAAETAKIVAFRGAAPSVAQSLVAQYAIATFRTGWRYIVTFAQCRTVAEGGQGCRKAIGKNLLFSLEGLGRSQSG